MTQNDFHQAAGECFSEAINPPVPFEEISPHECCEVLWQQIGKRFTPATLASLSAAQKMALAQAFATYFECAALSLEQIETAIDSTIARWPPE